MNTTVSRLSDVRSAAERGADGRLILRFQDSDLRNGEIIRVHRTRHRSARPNTVRALIGSGYGSRPVPLPDTPCLAFSAEHRIDCGTLAPPAARLSHAILYAALGPDQATIAWAQFLTEFVSQWRFGHRIRVGDIRSWFRDNYAAHCVLPAELVAKGGAK